MRIYRVIWKSYDELVNKEEVKRVDFEDIQLRDYYIRAVDDDTNVKYIIPYTSIYDIQIIDQDL